MRPIRLGCGAGYAGDRIAPAEALAREGALDALIFECLAERTIAMAQRARSRDPDAGHDPLLEPRMRAVLPHCAAQGTKIISNMGAANPRRAGEKIRGIAQELGLTGLKIAVVEGDEIRDRLPPGSPVQETGAPLAEMTEPVISANAYLGAGPILDALRQGADIVITGRVADPSLFVAPILDHFGWADDDWRRLGQATLAGHMMECAAQVTGGYFADAGQKAVAGLEALGFPICELDAEGVLEIFKLPGAGGCVTAATCKEQMLYEVFDPAAYLTPDVTADFSGVTIADLGGDRVRLSGAGGRPAPERLKVSIGCRAGFMGEAAISYAGVDAAARARLAVDVLKKRLDGAVGALELRFDIVGLDALRLGLPQFGAAPGEAMVRAAGLFVDAAGARKIGEEVEALYVNGPFGGGGARSSVEEVIAIRSTFIDRAIVPARVMMLTT